MKTAVAQDDAAILSRRAAQRAKKQAEFNAARRKLKHRYPLSWAYLADKWAADKAGCALQTARKFYQNYANAVKENKR